MGQSGKLQYTEISSTEWDFNVSRPGRGDHYASISSLQ